MLALVAVKAASKLGRDAAGRYWPARAARLKVWLRCSQCGWDLFQTEVQRFTRWRRAQRYGELGHQRAGQVTGNRWCGPVQFQANPRYRQA